MAYKITFWDGQKEVSSKLWPCGLEAAENYAKVQLSSQRAQNRAKSVSVTCERTKQVVFTFVAQTEDSLS